MIKDITEHFAETELQHFLRIKHSAAAAALPDFKGHIDHCTTCWQLWNKVRWDAAMNSRGVAELREYLGDAFVPYFDSSWALANEWYEKNPKTHEEIQDFYKKTPHYMYNSLIFYESGDREDMRPVIDKLLLEYKPKSVLDFGSSTGSDGLYMLDQGCNVYFADFDSPTACFLKWRLNHRTYPSTIEKGFVTIEQEMRFPEVEMVWAIDVLEHMTDPFFILNTITPKTSLFVFFTDCDDKAGGRHPFHFTFDLDLFRQELSKRGFLRDPHKLLDVWQKVA